MMAKKVAVPLVPLDYLARAIKSQRSCHTDMQPSKAAGEWADWRLQAVAEDLAMYVKDELKVKSFSMARFLRKCGFNPEDGSLVGTTDKRIQPLNDSGHDCIVTMKGGEPCGGIVAAKNYPMKHGERKPAKCKDCGTKYVLVRDRDYLILEMAQ